MTRALFHRRILLTAAVLACAQAYAQECGGDSFLCGTPLTLQQVQQAVGVIYEGRLREAIRRRGIVFQATGKELELCRRAGASAALLDELKRAAPPPAPRAPELDPREKLALRILQDAASALGGQEGAGFTVAGRMRIAGSEPGWPFSSRMRGNGTLSEIEIDANGLRRIAFAEADCALDRAAAAELPPGVEKGLISFCMFQPAILLRRLFMGDFKRTVEGPLITATREWVLHATGPQGNYEVAFSHSLAPVELRYQPPESGAAAMEARFTGYMPVHAGGRDLSYPGVVSIGPAAPSPAAAEFLIEKAGDGAKQSGASP